MDYFTKVSPMHIDEDALVLNIVTYILTRWCMKLAIYKVCNMLAATIEKKFHYYSPIYSTGRRKRSRRQSPMEPGRATPSLSQVFSAAACKVNHAGGRERALGDFCNDPGWHHQ
jgi:hypothetical protein